MRLSVAILSRVALFTRAWIEMYPDKIIIICFIVALFTRAWIEIKIFTNFCHRKRCRPLYEGVD